MAGQTNNKERQNYSANGRWKAEMSNMYHLDSKREILSRFFQKQSVLICQILLVITFDCANIDRIGKDLIHDLIPSCSPLIGWGSFDRRRKLNLDSDASNSLK